MWLSCVSVVSIYLINSYPNCVNILLDNLDMYVCFEKLALIKVLRTCNAVAS